jgi:DNA repair photolyase
MSLVKSGGNMYDWVTHCHAHLGGECPHKCSYCYVGRNRFGRPDKYTGSVRLIEEEFNVDYGRGNTIFIEHMNDLFARGVPGEWISRILVHTKQYQENTYVFQTKNPAVAWSWRGFFPRDYMIGTTIETNRDTSVLSLAPRPADRANYIQKFREIGRRVFVTIEPILLMRPEIMASWMNDIRPEFVNIGADSKGTGLLEPTRDDILELIERLTLAGIPIRKKRNLERILKL